jgi:hypothetical protein
VSDISQYRGALGAVRRTHDPLKRTDKAAEVIEAITAELTAARDRRNVAARTVWAAAEGKYGEGLWLQRLLGLNKSTTVRLREQWAREAIVGLGVLTAEALDELSKTDRPAFRALLHDYEHKLPPEFVPITPPPEPEEALTVAAARTNELRDVLSAAVDLRDEAMAAMLAAGARPIQVAQAARVSSGRVGQMDLRRGSAA